MNHHNFPLVSICIPTYNGEEFLNDALQSALSQTYPNIEILVSDDDSSDQTLAIVNTVCTHSRYKLSVFRHERLGLVGNWNFCLKNAKGEYIKFLFQDDILEPSCIAEMVALAEQDAEVGLVFSKRNILLTAAATSDPRCILIYESCQNVHNAWSNLQSLQPGKTLLADPNLLEDPINKIGEPTAVLLRKQVFESVGYFDSDFFHLVDIEMWLRISGHYKIGFIDKYLVSFRIHSKQETNTNIQLGKTNLDLYRLYAKLLYSPEYDGLDQSSKHKILPLVDKYINAPLKELEVVRQSLAQTEKSLAQTEKSLAQSQADLSLSQLKLSNANDTIVWMETSKFWKLRNVVLLLKKKLLGNLLKLTLPSKLKDYFESSIAALKIASSATENQESVDHSLHNTSLEKSRYTELSRISLSNFLLSNAELSLQTSENPLLSIVVVLHNRAELTFQCIRSIKETVDQPFELIIVDNASQDETALLLEKIRGIKLISNPENRHFLAAVNQAADIAKGQYLLLLNNDAQLMPGGVSIALQVFQDNQMVGAVGGKVSLLNGKLQEAGSIIWNDGSCLGYGRNANPLASEYMYIKDVDYCSGAFLLTPTDLFKTLGKFDSAFSPAYYEETDYCVRLWESGNRIIYHPDVSILHYEFASSRKTEEALQLQVSHQSIFCDKHAAWLSSQYSPDRSNILFARQRFQNGTKRVLLIDDLVPHTWMGSGFPRANQMINLLTDLGCFVSFYPILLDKQPSWKEIYSDIPRTTEVLVGETFAEQGLQQFLLERKGYYDLLIVSRPHNMKKMISIMQKNKEILKTTKLIYDAEALFALRDISLNQLKGVPLTEAEKSKLIEKEINLAKLADRVITVSKQEADLFLGQNYQNVSILGHSLVVIPTQPSFNERNNILFVGSIYQDESPNADSLIWFIEEILPQINSHFSEPIRLIVAGVNQAEAVLQLAGKQVLFKGRVNDLTDLYSSCRIFIAPTRYAAGIPHKVHEAAARGIPVVSTPLIAAQLGWRNEEDLLVGSTPEEFAQQCFRLYSDQALWQKIRNSALDRVQQDCSPDVFQEQLATVLKLCS
ncbi:MAG: glycosyltransferase [Leptolyngbyaceae cyanobacterium]